MKRKPFVILCTLIIITIFLYHLSINVKIRIRPASETWSKEVLISQGNINTNPALIEYKENYIIAHNNDRDIKLLLVDKNGKVKKEKSFKSGDNSPMDINVITDGKTIDLSWSQVEGKVRTCYGLRLDDSFNVLDRYYVNDTYGKIQLGNDALTIVLEDKLRYINIRTGKTIDIDAPMVKDVKGVKYKEGYYFVYAEPSGDFNFFSIKGDKISEGLKTGAIKKSTRVNMTNFDIAISDDWGYIIGEFKYRGEFAGASFIRFDMETGECTYNTQFKNMHISNVKSAGGSSVPSIIISGDHRVSRKKLFTDIIKINIGEDFKVESFPISRSDAVSVYAAFSEDTAIYCDYVNTTKMKLFMVSSRPEFIKAHTGTRAFEIFLALIDTLEAMLVSVLDIIVYGSLWIIPSIFVASIITLFEYRLIDSRRRKGFVLSYLISIIIKSYVIYIICYKKYGFYVTDYVSLNVGMFSCAAIGLLCLIYGYYRYKEDLQTNTIVVKLSSALIVDTVITQLLFLPFLL